MSDKSWSKQDDADLKRMIREGRSLKEIAAVLERSFGEVQRRSRCLGPACRALRPNSSASSTSATAWRSDLCSRFCLLVLRQFARQSLLHRMREIKAAQFPGQPRELEPNTELLLDRHAERQRHAELA
jgi:hypothetical protein